MGELGCPCLHLQSVKLPELTLDAFGVRWTCVGMGRAGLFCFLTPIPDANTQCAGGVATYP